MPRSDVAATLPAVSGEGEEGSMRKQGGETLEVAARQAKHAIQRQQHPAAVRTWLVEDHGVDAATAGRLVKEAAEAVAGKRLREASRELGFGWVVLVLGVGASLAMTLGMSGTGFAVYVAFIGAIAAGLGMVTAGLNKQRLWRKILALAHQEPAPARAPVGSRGRRP
jgi:hypothetical protein